MTTYEFTLRIDKRLESEDEMEGVYSRCQDCSLLVEGAVTLLQFDREADSLQDAIRTAITDVNAAGHHVTQVEMAPAALTTQTA